MVGARPSTYLTNFPRKLPTQKKFGIFALKTPWTNSKKTDPNSIYLPKLYSINTTTYLYPYVVVNDFKNTK